MQTQDGMAWRRRAWLGALGALLAAAGLAGAASPAGAFCPITGCPGTGGGGITTWSLDVSVDGPGTVADGTRTCAATGCDWRYPDGSTATPTATAGTGYRFAGWTGDCSGATCSLTMNANHAVTAHFALQAPVITRPSEGVALTSTTGGSTIISFTRPAGTSTTCAVDARTAVPCSSPWPTGALPTGTHTVVVTASDGTLTAAATRSWSVIDLPDTHIGGTPAAGARVFSRHTGFDLSGTNSATEFQCRLDGGVWRDCRDTVALDAASFAPGGALAGGAHELEVRAGVVFQAVHYFDTTPAAVNWTVLEPDTAVGGTPASFTLSDPTGSADAFRCSLDGAPARSCTSPLDVAAQLHSGRALAPGVHTLDAWGTRTTGGETVADPTPAHRAWTVAAPAPPAPVTPPAAAPAQHVVPAPPAPVVPPTRSARPHVHVSYVFVVSHGRTRFARLRVRGIPPHGKVRVTCHHCRLAHRRIRIRHGRADLKPLVRRVRLKAGAWIQIRVSAPGMRKQVVRFTARRTKAPRVITRG